MHDNVRVRHPQAIAEVQHPANISGPHFGHEPIVAEVHVPPPLDDVDDPELEPPEHVPALHVAPAPSWVQSAHVLPPVPQFALSVPVWHMLLLSQQPMGQLVESHVAPPLLDEVELPPSSPLPLLLVEPPELLGYPLELPVELDDPDELAPLDPLLVVRAPEELLTHLPSSAGSGADVAQAATATPPARRRTFAGVPRWRINISDSLRGSHRETTQYDPIERRL
jgi:hypothetical protein